MRLLIRRSTSDGTGEELFEGSEVILGRATDCTILLPGLLVALRHARLLQSTERLLKVESLCPMGVELNGLTGVQSADVQVGDVLRIGGHRLTLSQAEGELALDVELADPAALARGRSRHTLSDAGLGMRRPALWLTLVTLVLGLLAPLVIRLLHPPPAVAAVLPGDRLWLTDGISNAHMKFGNDCGVCHQTLFVPVRDEACMSCHAGIRQHSDDPAIVKVDGLEGRRCASCHREHQGAHGVLPEHPGICTDCHGAPERFADFPDLRRVSDFERDHPEFRPTVTVAKGDERVAARVPQSQGMRDASGLVFPHDVHLQTSGVRGPDGIETLDCEGCHARSRGEASFKPVRFAAHCQRCHQLDVDAGGTPVRLPHGDNELARAALLAHVQVPAEPATEEAREERRRRPGDAAPRPGRVDREELVNEVIENRVCAKCHETVRPEGKAVSTRPLQVRQSWLVHAHFTHEAHDWQKCDDCHAEQASSTADDLSLPSIESCRGCHGGVNSSAHLQSTCIDCHRFHEASRLVMGALADVAEQTAAEKEE